MAEKQIVHVDQFLSGHDEDFVSPVDEDLHCLICHLPLRKPVLTRCGHRYCRQCLQKYMERQESKDSMRTCPADREELDPTKDIFPDKATERKILSYIIRCPSDGCEWNGELREKEDHLSSCSFQLVFCSNGKCSETVKRKDMYDHMNSTCQWKMEDCVHCYEEYPKCLIQDHVDECAKRPVECPNGCDKIIVREETDAHIETDCPLTEVSCPYVEIGCNTKILRKELESHLQSKMGIHLESTLKTFKETTVKLEEKVDQLKLKQMESEQERAILKNEIQELTIANASLRAKVAAQEKEISLLKGESSTFVWKIKRFQDILQQAKNGAKKEVYSVPFYTGKQGYHLSVCMRPEGEITERNKYLSVLLRVIKGKFDAILPWPFRCKITFTLVDQRDDPNDRMNVTQSCLAEPPFERQTSESGFSERGVSSFVSHKVLMTRNYLVHDTLFLQVEFHPL